MSEKFYLGKVYDPVKRVLTDQPLSYDPADLTTHAVVTGMTGSGKTGLCIAIMEEAALQGIPAILIDPKGDLTNLLLHFPSLAAQEFQPWLDAEMVQRAGKTLEQAAQEASDAWKKGLADWGIQPERIQALQEAVQYAIFTPGSDAGLPISVLSSLTSPGLAWDGNRELLNERIGSTVTALLALVGFKDIDPIRSREHILLSNIFQAAWSQDKPLDLTELLLQIQTPPFEKLGAFAVEAFFPSKERMDLALRLNNILASPSFELWRSGQPLDIPALLHTADGKPRHSVFYLAHLPDAERMFFVTLLFSAIETWMRTQTGSAGLRALVYMDEIFGYLPPTAIPPSKPPLLRMLKQARAFGLGLILATQNPVDVDYKGLSNAGTWFIGKLQTDQDKQRLLDGLEGAAPGTYDRAALDRLISGLGKRVFLMNNIHAKGPVLFQSRWVMNFLAGPLSRTHIPLLNKLAGARAASAAAASVAPAAQSAPTARAAAAPAPQAAPLAEGSLTRPAVPSGFGEYFLPLNTSFTKAVEAAGIALAPQTAPAGLVYRPALAASAQVRFLDRKYGLDLEQVRSVLVARADKRGMLRWETFQAKLPGLDRMDPNPDPQARFAPLELPLSDTRLLTAMQKDFTDWVYRTSKVTIRANQALGVFAAPDVSEADFTRQCAEAARSSRDSQSLKATAALDKQITALQVKIAREERELNMDETELSQRKGEELATHAENVIGLLGGRKAGRRLSSSLSKRRMTEQAKADVQESIDALAAFKAQLAHLEKTRQAALEAAGTGWGEAVNQVSEIPVSPKKTDIYIDLFGVAWLPCYQVQSGRELLELPAYR